jgi:hypothetical protein
MYLYKNFCYETIDEVADSIYSEVFLGNGDAINSVTVAGNTVQITASNQNSSYLVTTTPPSCTQPGFNNSFFGVDIDTAAELGFMCAFAVISVWCIKIAKRGA